MIPHHYVWPIKFRDMTGINDNHSNTIKCDIALDEIVSEIVS